VSAQGQAREEEVEEVRALSSPLKYKLKLGKFKFAVRAIDAAGNVDQTPAKKKFKRLARG
jgi:hypothetical protein